MLTRVGSIADSGRSDDPAYVDGLRRALAAAIDHGLAAVDSSHDHEPPVPVEPLAQARRAARCGVDVNTVLRRYFAGYNVFCYFLIEEARGSGREGLIDGTDLQRLLASQAGRFDRLLAAVGEEHMRESALFRASSEQRQAEQVMRLLEGEMIDTADIAYDFEGWHLGAIAAGPDAVKVVRGLAKLRDCGLLSVQREGAVWAWLGTRRSHETLKPDGISASPLPRGTSLALGEPGLGLVGWRRTHRQALAALSVAQRAHDKLARYADVALLATALRDGVLADWLVRHYLTPLERERDGGEALRETLRAYFAAGGSLSAAASALGVSRRTVSNRLRKVEGMVGCHLHVAAADIALALRLDEFIPRQASSRIASSDVH